MEDWLVMLPFADFLDHPWDWGSTSRSDACLVFEHEPILVVSSMVRPGPREHVDWFTRESPYFPGTGSFDVDNVTYFRRVEGAVARPMDRAVSGRRAPAPVAEPEPQPRAEPPPAPPCRVLSVNAVSHRNRKPKHGFLEIVPTSGSRSISLSSQMKGGCGMHPTWEISGAVSERKAGAKTDLRVPSWKLGLRRGGALAARGATPKTYNISVHACQGQSHALELHAYPADQVDIEVSITKDSFELSASPDDWSVEIQADIRKAFQTAKKIEYTLDNLLKVWVQKTEFQCLDSVKGTFSAGWQEHDDHRAFFGYEASIGVDPLIRASVRIPFSPTAAIPAWLKEWTTDLVADFYLYLQFGGSISLSGKWFRRSPDKANSNAEAKGKVGVKVGGSLFLMKKQAVNIDVNGGTEISATAEPARSRQDEIALDYEVEWGGLTAEITLEALWGTVAYRHSFQIMDQRPIHHGQWAPFGD